MLEFDYILLLGVLYYCYSVINEFLRFII